MNTSVKITACAFTIASLLPLSGKSQDLLTGDTRLACEAILCLATASPPNECSSALKRYLSISFRNPGETARGRANFLKMCPRSDRSSRLQSFLAPRPNVADPSDELPTVPARSEQVLEIDSASK